MNKKMFTAVEVNNDCLYRQEYSPVALQLIETSGGNASSAYQ
jgi:hypothetical protein